MARLFTSALPLRKFKPHPQLTPWQTREVPGYGVRKGILDYLYELERTSNRVRVFPYGTSTEGRPMVYAVISSPQNWAQVDKYLAINDKLADPRQIASDEEALALAKQGKFMYWLSGGIHASERHTQEVMIQVAYDLAGGKDEWADLVLDNAFVAVEWIDPDGLDLITDHFYKYDGMPYQTSSPPCYNHYICHDTNRDFVGLEVVEHQNSVLQRQIWKPQLQSDLHQSRDLLYLGMPADPVNYNYHPISSAEMLGMNGYVITQMIAEGFRGVFTYDYANMWNPTYNHMYTVMHNGTGGWWELQSARWALPRTITGGRNDGHRTWFNPYPYYSPFEWTHMDAVTMARNAVEHSMTYTARNKVDWLYNFYVKGKTKMEEATGKAPFAFVIPADGGDQGDNYDVADLINDFIVWQDIEVDRATADFVADGQQFHAGDFVIRLNQPYGLWAQLLLTRQEWPAEEVVNPYLGGPGGREYDTYAWTLGLMADVEVVGLEAPLPGDVSLSPVTEPVPYVGSLSGGPSADYAVEHESNNGWVPALGQIWSDAGLSVSQVDAPFSAAGHDFPAGTFLVHTDGSQASHDKLAALVEETGLTGYAIGSGEVPASVALEMAGIGLLYEPNLSSLETGWVAIRMDRSTIPSYRAVTRADIRDGNLDGLDTIVLGSATTTSIVEGRTGSNVAPPYYGGIGESGVANLKSFVEGGGTLVLLGRAGELPIEYGWDLGLTYLGRPPTCRGSILRIEVDPTKKVGYGYDQFESAYIYDSRVPLLGVEPGSPAEVVAWYPTEGELLQSGYIEPGGDAEFRGTPAIVDVPMGDGNVILINFDSVFRGFSTGQYMFLWNSIIEGARSD
jgi:hypothetical protein